MRQGQRCWRNASKDDSVMLAMMPARVATAS
jgi:hypothetical protein